MCEVCACVCYVCMCTRGMCICVHVARVYLCDILIRRVYIYLRCVHVYM